MVFTSLHFFIFFCVVLLTYWSLKKNNHQNYFLLISSLFFYGYADWKFLSLIIICALIGYLSALAMETYKSIKKIFLVCGVSVPFGILFVFKYFNFFIDSIYSITSLIGLPFQKTSLSLVLPIGISFFTFQTVAYVIDVYQGRQKAEKSFTDVLLFISFFPQLVAGPIERPTHLMPQIQNKRVLKQEDVFYGSYLILQGLIKKLVIADNLAPIVNLLFKYENISGGIVVVGIVAFAFQIYGDFSGYTDIARGTARLLGFKIVLNFNHPYISSNPTDFWHRWHISLSTWFRDYLYIPLGGNRKGWKRTYINLMITCILCGLWHGASYNFVLWGIFHGVALVIHKVYNEATSGAEFRKNKIYEKSSKIITFIIVLYGWLLFRITDISDIWVYSISIFTNWKFLDIVFLAFAQIAPFVLLMIIVDYFESKFLAINESNIIVKWSLAPYFAMLFLVLAIFISDSSGDFIYFKF